MFCINILLVDNLFIVSTPVNNIPKQNINFDRDRLFNIIETMEDKS